MERKEVFLNELSPNELIGIWGGNPIGTLLRRLSPWGAFIGLAIYVYDNKEAFIEGVKEGYESTQK